MTTEKYTKERYLLYFPQVYIPTSNMLVAARASAFILRMDMRMEDIQFKLNFFVSEWFDLDTR